MKEKMLKALQDHWTNGRDDDLIKEFIIKFFDSYQPERSKREDTNKDVSGFKYDDPRISDKYL